MRKTVFLTMVLTLALACGFAQQAQASDVFIKGRQTTQARRAASSQGLLSAQRGGATGRLRFAPRRINERNRRLQYRIKASYPQLLGARETSASQFNRVVRDLITAEVNDFKKEFEPPDQGLPKEIQESTLDVAYEVDYSDADLISVSFGISTYNAGAAHPNHYTRALNYDLRANRALSLSDLFRPRSNYLQTISDYVIKELKKKLGPEVDGEWIERGAAPDSENYRSWNITRRGLSVTFDPYQVASYADGQHIVVVPYTVIRNLINTDSPLAALVKQSPARRSSR